MFRVVRQSSVDIECVEADRQLYRQTIMGAIEDHAGRTRITRTGGFWNCHLYEFAGDTPYPAFPPEPRLRWRFGLLGIRERIESEDFSGAVRRERTGDQLMFRLGTLEWRFDASQQELYFEPPEPKVELRTTLLAFRFFARCMV